MLEPRSILMKNFLLYGCSIDQHCFIREFFLYISKIVLLTISHSRAHPVAKIIQQFFGVIDKHLAKLKKRMLAFHSKTICGCLIIR